MCHFQVLLTLAGVFHFFCHRVLAGYLRASHSCCQAPNLPWAPRTDSSCCCQVQSLSWVPVRPPIAALLIATLCHVPLSGSSHCWWVPFFV
ncbi:unnamed protein product, partial [Staurois parvus]